MSRITTEYTKNIQKQEEDKMFENSSSRTLPLPYPTLPNYKYMTSSLPVYQLPPINIPTQNTQLNTNLKKEDENSLISLPPLPRTPQLSQQLSPLDTSPSSATTTTLTSSTTSVNESHQQHHRKKRQCPECKLYFSNLATHKSTHLSINSRPHICLKCSRGFARSNDLIRHENSHLKDIGKFLYKCPFYNGECHSNGCFSRCDTFKNHLKLLHFQYPVGTKKKDRSKVRGDCKLCGMHFNNVDEWLKLHINTHQCLKICNH